MVNFIDKLSNYSICTHHLHTLQHQTHVWNMFCLVWHHFAVLIFSFPDTMSHQLNHGQCRSAYLATWQSDESLNVAMLLSLPIRSTSWHCQTRLMLELFLTDQLIEHVPETLAIIVASGSQEEEIFKTFNVHIETGELESRYEDPDTKLGLRCVKSQFDILVWRLWMLFLRK